MVNANFDHTWDEGIEACTFPIEPRATKQADDDTRDGRPDEQKTPDWGSTATLTGVLPNAYIEGHINSKAHSKHDDFVNFISILVLLSSFAA